MSGAADEHRRIAGAFATTVEGTTPDSWDQPAPVEGWVARDVVRHLVEWFPAFLEGAAGIALPAGPSVDDDPVGAWRTQTDAVQALLDDAATAQREHDLPHIGRMPLEQAIDMIYTSDVFLHRWDLARAHRPGRDARPGEVRGDVRKACCRWTRAPPERSVRAARRRPRRRRCSDQAARVSSAAPRSAVARAHEFRAT